MIEQLYDHNMSDLNEHRYTLTQASQNWKAGNRALGKMFPQDILSKGGIALVGVSSYPMPYAYRILFPFQGDIISV